MDSKPRTPVDLDHDSFDVKGSISSIIRASRRYWRSVLVTTLVTIALVALYIRLYPPVYIGRASLMAEREYDAPRDQFYVDWNIFRKDDSRTEIELMQSGPVLSEVIKREKLTYDDVYHPFMSHTVYLWEQSAIGKAYRSVKHAILGEENFGLSPAELEFVKTIGDFREGISVAPVGESNVGVLTVKGPSRRVASIANTLVKVYLEQRVQRHASEASQSLGVLGKQTDIANDTLTEIEKKRLAFASQNSLAFDFQKESVEITKLAELEAGIAASRSKVAALDSSIREIDRELERSPDMVTTSTVSQLNAMRESLKLKRLDLETSLISIRDRYLEDSPEVTELKQNLKSLDEMLTRQSERVNQAETRALNTLTAELRSKRNAYATELVGTQAGLQVMEETARGLRSRLSQVPALQARLKELDREVAVAAGRYQVLNSKRAQAEVSVSTAKAATPSLHVVDYATPPAQAYWPKTKVLYLAALVIGLLLGVLLAQVQSALAGRVHLDDAERGALGQPLYGVLELPSVSPALTILRGGGDSGNGRGRDFGAPVGR